MLIFIFSSITKSAANDVIPFFSLALPSSSWPLLKEPLADIAPKTRPEDGKHANLSDGELCDPLSWFGVLVPSSLRAAQSDFKQVVEETIPQLASVLAQLKEVERQVLSVRAEAKMEKRENESNRIKIVGCMSV